MDHAYKAKPAKRETMTFQKGDRIYIDRAGKQLFGTVLYQRRGYGPSMGGTWMVEFDDKTAAEHNQYGDDMHHAHGARPTGALAGQAGKLKATAKFKALEAKQSLGESYWKSAAENVRTNLTSQHGNFVAVHKAHVNKWVAGLNNLTKDLVSTKAKVAKAPDEAKRAKAEDAVDKVIGRMDEWLAQRDGQPYEKAAQMFEAFELGGAPAAKRLEGIKQAAEQAQADLAAKYETKKAKAIKDAQKSVVNAVKAAKVAGWNATGLANSNVYA